TKLAEGDMLKGISRFSPEAMEKNQALVDLLKRVASDKAATPAQIALAWILAQRPYIVPIPGTTKLAHLEENIKAASINFTTLEMQEINGALATMIVKGDRLRPDAMKLVG